MIIDKHALPDDPMPVEAPPAYEDDLTFTPFDKKHASAADQPVASSSRPPQPAGAPSTSPKPITAALGSTKKSPKSARRWFSPFCQAARTAQEVKKTVVGLLRDVVQVPEIDAAMSILKNCQEACEEHGLSFSSILQERSVEGHSPLYWAIIKRPSDQVDSESDLVKMLLSLASPLTEDTVSEVRLACLQNSDQRLFQRLRRTAAFAPLSGSDEMLLGGDASRDDVSVEDIAGDEGAYVVTLRFVLFQKRMRISKHVDVEFIARGRMWRLQFLESDGTSEFSPHEKGAWLVRLSLMENSPPTYIDSHLLISDARSPTPSTPPTSPTSLDPMASLPGRLFTAQNKDPNRPKPNIELRIKTNSSNQLAPAPRSRERSDASFVHALLVPLSKSLMGNSLQYDGSSYIASDGALSARLEARLAKPDAECIIC